MTKVKQTKVKQFKQLTDYLNAYGGRIVLIRGDLQLSLSGKYDVYNIKKGTHRELSYRDALNYYRMTGWTPFATTLEARETQTRRYAGKEQEVRVWRGLHRV
ncbi:hypothetical protein RSA11_04475 [Exiguobacterium indicum]|uniref:Uncharacterized protein n=1 Tax=Exiguobacterium indicum TaxID=296995 RepID=A0AAW3MFP1_9BACL|nr:hypothetical protein [Exiguobacterium indicum]KTR27920.1 hypothetical protein RSA11_04475 [Exiguobacterium indicum]